MNINNYINAKQIALYITNTPKEDALEEALFPKKKQLGMELENARGSKQKAVALRPSTFDVAVKPRALKADVKIEKKEMPFFKESILVKESDRQKILLAMSANNQELVTQILGSIYENYGVLVEGARVQRRRMLAQLIQNGEINIVTDDGDIVVDYGVQAKHKETLSGTSKWSDPQATIVEDIQRWQKIVVNNGYTKPGAMVLTHKTFNYICNNLAIRDEIRGNSKVILTDEMFEQYFMNKLNLKLLIVQGNYFAEDGTEMSYYEDYKVTLIPANTILGNTVFGTTPEEADKLYGTNKLDTEIVDMGVAITTMLKEDPVTVETKVSQLTLPSFSKIDNCFFATVHTD